MSNGITSVAVIAGTLLGMFSLRQCSSQGETRLSTEIYEHHLDADLQQAIREITPEERLELIKKLAKKDSKDIEGLKDASKFLQELAKDTLEFQASKAALLEKYTDKKSEDEKQEVDPVPMR